MNRHARDQIHPPKGDRYRAPHRMDASLTTETASLDKMSRSFQASTQSDQLSRLQGQRVLWSAYILPLLVRVLETRIAFDLFACQLLRYIIKRLIKVDFCIWGSSNIYAVGLFEINFINLPTFSFGKAKETTIPAAHYIPSKLTLRWLISIT